MPKSKNYRWEKWGKFYYIDNETISISLNETILFSDINQVIAIFAEALGKKRLKFRNMFENNYPIFE
jgi:glycine dehydrogenase